MFLCQTQQQIVLQKNHLIFWQNVKMNHIIAEGCMFSNNQCLISYSVLPE